MAIDHFTKHKYARERTDWNFNVLLDDQLQAAELAHQYRPLIKHSGLYEPVPGRWLHATVMRVGFLEDFTEAEMLAVTDRLEPALADVLMPELLLGQRWWLWNGGPVLSITPQQQLQEIFCHVLNALVAIIGRDRLPPLTIESVRQPMKTFDHLLKTISAIAGRDRLPVRLQFVPHVTLAYPRTYHDELGLLKQLRSQPIEGVAIQAKRLSLIKQRVENNHYTWETVRELPIGQTKSKTS